MKRRTRKLPTVGSNDSSMRKSTYTNSGSSLLDAMTFPGHKLRSVSVRHLATVIRMDMVEKALGNESTFYDIEPEIIRGKGRELQCPRDGKLGTAYVDALYSEEDVGVAEFMLSYVWSYTVADVAETLLAFCLDQRLSPVRTYVWMCCFCINQHRVSGEKVPFETFRQEFASSVIEIGTVLAVMTPWHSPAYIKRVWCCFEMYTAVTSNRVRVHILMPPKDVDDVSEAMLESTGLDRIWHIFSHLRVEDSSASVKEDMDSIFRMITEGPGFERINNVLRLRLRRWIADVTERRAQRLLAADSSLDPSGVKLCAKAGSLLREIGFLNRAAALLEETWLVQRVRGGWANAEGAYLLKQLGVMRQARGKFDEAEDAFTKAHKIYEAQGTLLSPNGALLVDAMGDLSYARCWYDDALQHFEEAMDVARKVHVDNSMIGAIILRNSASAMTMLGDLPAAEVAFAKACEIHESTNTEATPMHALLLQRYARHQMISGYPDTALDMLQEAWLFRQQSGTIDTHDGRELLEQLTEAHGACGGDVVRVKTELGVQMLRSQESNIKDFSCMADRVKQALGRRLTAKFSPLGWFQRHFYKTPSKNKNGGQKSSAELIAANIIHADGDESSSSNSINDAHAADSIADAPNSPTSPARRSRSNSISSVGSALSIENMMDMPFEGAWSDPHFAHFHTGPSSADALNALPSDESRKDGWRIWTSEDGWACEIEECSI